MPRCAWKCVSTANSDGVDISVVPECYLLGQLNSHKNSHKNYLKDRCLMNSQPTFLLLTYF